MKTSRSFRLALVTAPDLKSARLLARAALDAGLAACVNLLPRIESHYRWQGKIERGTEVLMILKTTSSRLAQLERLILDRHPYDTPEFIVIQLAGGNERYLEWVRENCRLLE
jgi:periplasmic divalent cation tolerance protein